MLFLKKPSESFIKRSKTQKYQALDIAAGIKDPNAGVILKKVKSKLYKTVKNAKRKYYQNVINGLDPHNIFQAVKWLSTVRQYNTPSIKRQDGTLAIDH